jgi:hypothetical protein
LKLQQWKNAFDDYNSDSIGKGPIYLDTSFSAEAAMAAVLMAAVVMMAIGLLVA